MTSAPYFVSDRLNAKPETSDHEAPCRIDAKPSGRTHRYPGRIDATARARRGPDPDRINAKAQARRGPDPDPDRINAKAQARPGPDPDRINAKAQPTDHTSGRIDAKARARHGPDPDRIDAKAQPTDHTSGRIDATAGAQGGGGSGRINAKAQPTDHTSGRIDAKARARRGGGSGHIDASAGGNGARREDHVDPNDGAQRTGQDRGAHEANDPRRHGIGAVGYSIGRQLLYAERWRPERPMNKPRRQRRSRRSVLGGMRPYRYRPRPTRTTHPERSAFRKASNTMRSGRRVSINGEASSSPANSAAVKTRPGWSAITGTSRLRQSLADVCSHSMATNVRTPGDNESRHQPGASQRFAFRRQETNHRSSRR